MKKFIKLILIVALTSCIYYLLISPQFSQQAFLNGEISKSELADLTSARSFNNGPDFNRGESNLKNDNFANDGLILSSDNTKSDERSSDTGRHLQIFGRVVDQHDQPIDDTLVTEGQYLFRTHTDSDGKYSLFVDMPEHRSLVMRFLRSGFKDKRIQLDAEVLKQQAKIELDVSLKEDNDAISIDGWIGNDIGAGLGGLKIRITYRDRQGLDKVFLTTFSDDRGYFTLNGIRSGDLYKLTVFTTPEYLYYLDDEFSVTQNTPQLKIILESLVFIDIDGMIVNRKAVPIPNFEIYISNISTGTHIRKIVSDSSGFFSLQNFPAGEVSLSSRGPEYFKIKGLALAANEYRNLRLVVDKGDHYLSGWVSDENGTPLAKAMVKLDTKILDGSIEYLSYRVKGTDSAGNFYFDNLGSGAHELSVEAGGFNKREIIHLFDSQTEKIHITLSRKE